jgi:hypothetical protein
MFAVAPCGDICQALNGVLLTVHTTVHVRMLAPLLRAATSTATQVHCVQGSAWHCTQIVR